MTRTAVRPSGTPVQGPMPGALRRPMRRRMRRRMPRRMLGPMLALLGLLLPWLLVGGASAQERPLDPRVFEIANELRCPTCVSESVAQSSAPIAREMRVIIQEQLDAGRSRAEILAYFQERYGDWILLAPPRRGVHLVVWLLPAAAAVTGVVLLLVLLRRWRGAAEAGVPADPADLERVRAALADSADAATDEPAAPARS